MESFRKKVEEKRHESLGDIPEARSEFKGLSFESPSGSVKLPNGAEIVTSENNTKSSRLKDDYVCHTEGEDFHKLKVNWEALQGVLIRVCGRELFNSLDKRLMVLTKVNDAHVPFYMSSEGTDGKGKNEWHPFFGVASISMWIVKGSLSDTEPGGNFYNADIESTRQLLNENLQLPPVSNIDADGEIFTRTNRGRNKSYVHKNITDYIGYLDKRRLIIKGEKTNLTSIYERGKLTNGLVGYSPHDKMYLTDKPTHRWLHEIVSRI